MSRALTIIAYAVLALTISYFFSARAYDRGFAEGYRDLAARVVQGLREKRDADTAEDECSSDPT